MRRAKQLRNNIIYSFLGSVTVLAFLLFLLFNVPHTAQAGLAEDLIAREGWRTISLDFDGASLLNILKLFSQQSGLNFVASPGVSSKKVTLYLENVPLREALEKILNANKLTYELAEGSNIFIVKDLIKPDVDLVTRVFPLKYAQVSGSPLNSVAATKHSGLVDAVRERMSSYGKVTEDTRTNSLIVSDTPVYLQQIEATIKALDVPVPQVMIEVEIIDTSKSLIDSLGFSWQTAGSLFTYALPAHIFPDTTAIIGGGANNGKVSLGGPIGSTVSLSHLRTNTDTKILARPKILTLSNEQAEIKIAGKEVVSTTSTLDSTGQTSSISATFEDDIGVTLAVTPSVNIQTGEITMALEPKVRSTSSSGFSDQNNNEFKNVNERSAKVKLVAKNNQTIVLGGLIRQDLDETRRKVPFLGDVPFLGALFRHKNTNPKTDREMLVFITPRIFDSSGEGIAHIAHSGIDYNQEILAGREQADYSYRKEEIDKELRTWDN